MKQLKIDPEFQSIIPPMTDDQFNTLEKTIVSDGRVFAPIHTWNGIIVDGHNRYAVVQKHPEIPFETVERDFASRYEAIVWICNNQLGKHNLTSEQISYVRGQRYEAEKMSQGGTGANQHTVTKEQTGQNVQSAPSRREIKDGTAGRIGKEYGVNGRTIRRDADYAKGVDAIEKDSPGMKGKLLSGSINTTKTEIANYPNLEKKEKEEMIEQLNNGGTVSSNKERQKSGNTNENRERWSATRKAADELYDTERQTVYTPDDLKEELDFIVQDFIKKAKRTLAIRSTVLNEPGTREKIAAVLLAAETAVKEMKGLVL